MIAWPFIAFAVIFLALVCAHFIFAYRAWRTSRGKRVPEIDPNYVKLEDYFARSFRVKVAEWLKLPVYAAIPPGIKIILKGHERIRVSGSSRFPPQTQCEEILIVQGCLECGDRCTFHSEIYVKEDACVGDRSELQAIAADGNLILGDGVLVTRWADCGGKLEIGSNAVVRVRATAGKTILIYEGAQAGSAVAPTVQSGQAEPEGPMDMPALTVPMLALPGPKGATKPAEQPAGEGMDRKKLRKLSPDCWMYTGHLKPPAPLHITTKLIVKGDCILPAKSIVEGDLKVDGFIQIGAHSVCRGNVVANGEIWLGVHTRFQGVLHAGREIWLSRGVLGGSEDSRVAAYATDTLWLESGVVVHGKLASGDHVAVTGRTRTA